MLNDVFCSCGCLGGWEAAGGRRDRGGSSKGHGSSGEDPLHFSLPHRCLLLGSEGTIKDATFEIYHVIYFMVILALCTVICRARLRCFLGSSATKQEGMHPHFMSIDSLELFFGRDCGLVMLELWRVWGRV